MSDRAGLRLNIFTPNLEPWLIPNGNLQSLPPDTAPSPYCMSRDRTMNTNDERSPLLGGILMPVCRGGFHNYRFLCTQMRLNPPLCNGVRQQRAHVCAPLHVYAGKIAMVQRIKNIIP
ncbi:hypothetical protein [Coleofasciculus sp. E1-EBD-02]|uniref:hypothetical protein n=1 Tax=Coleofasciculus sp. E1-EBD-02 TaxID=3068481 RepID=UPI0040645F38